MTRFVAVAVCALVLSGCAELGFGERVEIQSDDATGSDKMRISPCACIPLDYTKPEFRWVG